MSNYIDNIVKNAVTYDLVSKPLADDMANEFSIQSTYAVGDYVMHDYKLYKCISAVTTAGNWNSAKWQECKIGDEINGGVKFTAQTLTSEQKAQARNNIGAVSQEEATPDAIRYSAQSLTDAQKNQARVNVGTVASTSIAEEFSTSKAYAVGDMVMYDSKLYKFKTAHSAGAWNNAQVDAVSVKEEISSLSNDLNVTYHKGHLINNNSSLFQRKTTGTNANNVAAFPNSTTRIVTYPPLSIEGYTFDSVRVSVEEGYKYIVYQIQEGKWIKEYSAYTWLTENDTFEINPLADHFVLMIAKTDDGEITVDDYDKAVLTYGSDEVVEVIHNNAVEYNTSQTLTDLERETARDNIGAASAIDVYMKPKTLNTDSSLFQRKTTQSKATVAYVNSTTRILTYPELSVEDLGITSISVTVEDGYKYIVYQIHEGEWVDAYSSYKWSTENNININIDPQADHVVLAIAKTDDSEITVDDYDKITFYTQSEIDEPIKSSINKSAVLYSEAQELTEEQKTQAQENIGVNLISDEIRQLSNVVNTTIGEITIVETIKEIHHGWMSADNVANLMQYEVTTHFVASVVPGMMVTILANKTNSTPYAFLKSYTPPIKNGDPYDLCDDCTRTVITKNTTVNVEVPSDCNYLFIGLHADGSAVHSPQSLKFDDLEIILEEGSQSFPPVVEQEGYVLSEIDDIKDDINMVYDRISEISSKTPDSAKDLYIGKLVQNDLSDSGIGNSSSVKVSQYSALAVPWYGVTVTIKCPDDYCVGFRSGETTTGSYISLNVDSGWLHNGDNYTFASANQIYRTYFGKNDGASAVTVAEITELLNNKNISITYLDDSENIVSRNFCNEEYIKNIMRGFSASVDKNMSINRMPIFSHTSDVHSDIVRLSSFAKYSDYLNVDASLVTGDIVAMSSNDKMSFFDETADISKTPLLLCMGNHDARGLGTKQLQHDVLAHTIEKYNAVTPQSEAYPTYYYYDVASKNIRVFSLNMYEAGQKTTNHWRWTQSQLDWFVSALSTVPSGYGVIVMMHSPEVSINSVADKTAFYQNGTVQTWGDFKPIAEIIDAFIGRTSISYSFTQETSGESETISVTGDFSSVDSTTEFICYVSGHRHYDGIGYLANTTHTQLLCNVCSGFALYGTSKYKFYAELSDCVRGGKGISQDAFNIYCIDRDAKTLRIARVGSNMTGNMADRKFMIIPYAI